MPNFNSNDVNGNGDDVFTLRKNGANYDIYGVDGVDGTNQNWEYLDSWAYRKNMTLPNTTWNVADWNVVGKNKLDGETTNATAMDPFPIGSYSNN